MTGNGELQKDEGRLSNGQEEDPLLIHVPATGSTVIEEDFLYDSTKDSALLAQDKEENGDGDGGVILSLEPELLHIWEILCILSTAFSYGCILTTLFLITLPVECQRIESEHASIAKSVALGAFVAIAGVTQLVSPLVGKISDSFKPPPPHDIGQRLPFLVLGSVMTVFGLLGQMFASYRSFWVRYSVAFFAHMIGLNIMYAMMLAMIPDQVPSSQTGIANGILAALLVTGSLFGFGLFHGFLRENIQDMYALYTCIVIVSSIATGIYGHDRDVEIALIRTQPLLPPTTTTAKSSTRQQQNGQGTPQQQHPISRRRKFMKLARKVTKKVVATPAVILRSMLITPVQELSWYAIYQSYTIDMEKHSDFFWVTVSRLFYYCGMSVQTFFMYFLHDIILLKKDPEGAVATLSIIGQIAGACTCVPVGIASDKLFAGKRKPFVHFACFVLAATTFSAIFARTMHGMVLIMIFLGGANGIYLTMDTSLAVDTLPKEFDGESGSAQLLGIWGVAAFLGSALGPMIGGPVLYYVGRQHSDESETTTANDDTNTDSDTATDTTGYSLAGYAVVLSLASFYFLLSSSALRFIRR
ncbi:Major Facilitator Superfamily [Seminavis robusta]|uniref:Major Facilitator Superfamily n=1 Tax=Seminavis robusta TaxID=568900 RepID=A0A9N8E149_9STRA|nr:Major Facilitator Superfamily [Seminavis robusta]|eukprot:Sro518_g158810.1 Major Facilitator Superfamily (585) ;mRNA; f:28440-30297